MSKTIDNEEKYLKLEDRKIAFGIDLRCQDYIGNMNIVNPYSLIAMFIAVICSISASTITRLMIAYGILTYIFICLEAKVMRKIYIAKKERNDAHVYLKMAMPTIIGTVLFGFIIIATICYLITVGYKFVSFFETYNKWVFFITLNIVYLGSQIFSMCSILLTHTFDDLMSILAGIFLGILLLGNMTTVLLVYVNILITIAMLQYAVRKFSENYRSTIRNKKEKLRVQRELSLQFLFIHSIIFAIYPHIYKLIMPQESLMNNVFIGVITFINMLCCVNALHRVVVTWMAPEKLFDYYQENDKSLEYLYLYKYMNGDFASIDDCKNAFSAAVDSTEKQE